MHFTVEAQKFASRFLKDGAIAIDATCGNGFDTHFLAEQVGVNGLVYGIDIQPQALEATCRNLRKSGLEERCRLIAGSHAELKTLIGPTHAGNVSVVMFNLGYLPLADKTIVTKLESTIAGLEQAFELVRANGLISVLAYPGHSGGEAESKGVQEWVEKHAKSLQVERYQDENNNRSPILWVLTVCKDAIQSPGHPD